MKKILLISMASGWVLNHRNDKLVPQSIILEYIMKNNDIFTFEGHTYCSVVVSFDSNKISVEDATERFYKLFEDKYEDIIGNRYLIQITEEASLDDVYTVEKNAKKEEEKGIDENSLSELLEEHIKSLQSEDDDEDDDEDMDDNKIIGVEEIKSNIDEIDNLIGCEEFKTLAHEIDNLSLRLLEKNLSNVFLSQSYLCAIGDGAGYSTLLDNFYRLLNYVGFCRFNSTNPVVEIKLPAPTKNDDGFSELMNALSNGNERVRRILSIDISEYINNLNAISFKNMLKLLESYANDFIYVFRIPFVDKDIIKNIENIINDRMFVRTITIAPFSAKQLQMYAKKILQDYGYEINDDAWENFSRRIVVEKSDGKFYGLNTVKKVVMELIYKKEQAYLQNHKDDMVISKEDSSLICDFDDSNLSGYEMLDNLIGCENIKQKIDEIISQIVVAKQTQVLNPSIHMRFVGNPGTGKTTIARIIGKILKEKGILRVGSFFEYSGRDFCGRYIGETAPKTQSMCRDAYGSVLFIDEAYSLYRSTDDSKDYGREALDTLISEMENHRNDLVVIMAGYPKEMETLMKGNAGLQSRMPYVLEFPNYNREQLYEIFKMNLDKTFKYESDLLPAVKEFFDGLTDSFISAKEFSNARFVRNLFERTWAKAAMRQQLDDESANIVIKKEDFVKACSDKEFVNNLPVKRKLGF